MAILERGYIHPQIDDTGSLNENQPIHRMAARNGLNLSADTLRKMDEDRQKEENQEK
jgi:hypothetical protein